MPAEATPSQQVRKTRAYRDAVRKLGARVRELRRERELTLEAASERGGLDLKHWQKIEVGGLNVTMATLVRVAKGLGVDVADLFAK